MIGLVENNNLVSYLTFEGTYIHITSLGHIPGDHVHMCLNIRKFPYLSVLPVCVVYVRILGLHLSEISTDINLSAGNFLLFLL